ncbi:MAG: hypothetical protein K9M98_03835 [Cephaloticoccus sp.]|nr:hypothetical protein [Cephaloticoccus sp.]
MAISGGKEPAGGEQVQATGNNSGLPRDAVIVAVLAGWRSGDMGKTGTQNASKVAFDPRYTSAPDHYW